MIKVILFTVLISLSSNWVVGSTEEREEQFCCKRGYQISWDGVPRRQQVPEGTKYIRNCWSSQKEIKEPRHQCLVI